MKNNTHIHINPTASVQIAGMMYCMFASSMRMHR